MEFHEEGITLHQETLLIWNGDAAHKLDDWALISFQYGFRVVGIRSEFYKMDLKDPVYAKKVIPTLERCNDMAASDDLAETFNMLD